MIEDFSKKERALNQMHVPLRPWTQKTTDYYLNNKEDKQLSFPFMENESKPKTNPKLSCCGYEIRPTSESPVKWNPYNKVVQCHNCGQTYEPKNV
jgi:hypothetical protein